MTRGIKYRADIDFIRGFSVIIVLLSHYDLFISGGFIGVDVFFVISGFVISRNYLSENQINFQFLCDFWLKRIRRLAPSLFVVVLITSVCAYCLLLPIDHVDYSKSLLGLLFYSSNFVFWKQSGYFDATSDEKLLLHTWSLSVEEQFYLLFPFFLMLILRKRKNIFLVLLVSSLLICLLGSFYKPIPTYYFPITRFWEIMVGVYMGNRGSVANKDYLNILMFFKSLAWIFLIIICFVLNGNCIYPGFYSIGVVVATTVLLVESVGEAFFPASILFTSLFNIGVFVGKLSYIIYLVHWPIWAMLNYFGVRLSIAYIFLLIFLVFVLSWLIYVLIEKPVRDFRVLGKKRSLMCAYLFVVISSVVYCSFSLMSSGFKQRYSKSQLDYSDSVSIEFIKNIGFSDAEILNPFLTPRFHTRKMNENIVFWGDSHAMVFIPGLVKYIYKNDCDLGVCSFTYRSTPPILGFSFSSDSFRHDQITSYSRSVFDKIISDPSLSHVVLAARWNGYGNSASEHFKIEYQEALIKLRSVGKKVFFFKDVPNLSYNPAISIRRNLAFQFLPKSFECLTRDTVTDKSNTEDQLIQINNNFNTKIVDPSNYFFSDSISFMTGDDFGSFYCDNHHLSCRGSDLLAPYIYELISK